jgi:nucleotide-binding universal stress UspA family protein
MLVPNSFSPPERFLIAFDGGKSSTKALKYIATSSFLKGLQCHIVTVVSDAAADSKSLDIAAAKLGAAGFDLHPSLLTGQPDEEIKAYVDANNIDLLVIGAYGHARIRNMIISSITTSIVTSCKIPLLLFR